MTKGGNDLRVFLFAISTALGQSFKITTEEFEKLESR